LDIGAIIAAIGGVFAWLGAAIGFTKNALDTTKSATELFDSGKRLLHIAEPDTSKSPETEVPPTDIEVERARAAADLIRSYAFFGFLEYLLWATKAIVVILALTRWFDTMTRWYRPRKNEE